MTTLSDRNTPFNPHTGTFSSHFCAQNSNAHISTTGIDAVLEQRGNRYGKFTGHAKITQDLKSIMHSTTNWAILTNDQKEALEMIMHKVGRILNGDPNYDDSWIDIGGYSKLVADRLTNGKEV